MTDRGPVIVDTDVFSRVILVTPSAGYESFGPLLRGRRVVLAAQTVGEVRAGALMRGWGERRVADLEATIGRLAVAPVDDAVAGSWAELKAECSAIGHALGQKIHDGDRWIAATARALGLPLASNDGIFADAPGVTILA